MRIAPLFVLPVLLTLPAAAAEPAEEPSSDVVAQREIAASPQAIYEVLLDTPRMARLAPERCMRKWEVAPDGQSFRVVYLVEAFRRKLDAQVTAPEAARRLEWDHLGNKGFVTRFSLAEAEAGTRLTLTTYVAPPGWPLRRYYAKTVQPAWVDCYETFLEAIASEVEAAAD